jgi:predicted nucleic acid-binding protein
VARAFVDTNVLIYAADHREAVKQAQADRLLARLAENDEIVVSAQVLAEYAAVALRKLREDPAAVAQQLDAFATLEVVPVTARLVRHAVTLAARYEVSYWDAAILAAAETAGCGVIFSEDLNSTQLYAGVRVINPFAG